MTSSEAEDHLLARLIPATVEQHCTKEVHGRTADDITSWLTEIAICQQRTAAALDVSPTDIRVPDLWDVSGRRRHRWIPAMLVAAIGAVMTAAVGYFASESARFDATITLTIAMYAVTAGLVVLTVFATVQAFSVHVSLVQLDLPDFRILSDRRRFWRELKRAVPVMLSIGCLLGFSVLIFADPPIAAICGVTAAVLLSPVILWLALSNESGAVSAPSVLVRRCTTYSLGLAMTAASSVAGTLATAAAAVQLLEEGAFDNEVFVFGLLIGVLAGLLVGLLGGLAFADGACWLRYALGVRSAARRNLLPRRPVRFLDWCVDVGLMRMSGNNLQFRHDRFRLWLIRRSAQEEWPGRRFDPRAEPSAVPHRRRDA